MSSKSRFTVTTWKNSLVGQLLLRLWVCHIIFFFLIGSIQYNSLKTSLYQNVEQNLEADYQSIKNTMVDWLAYSEPASGRLAELRPGNFVAFYGADYELRSLVFSYGSQNTELPGFLTAKLDFDLQDKALDSKPFVIGTIKEEKYMLLVKPIFSGIFSGGYIPRIAILPNQFQDRYGIILPGYAVIGEPLFSQEVLLEQNLRGYIFNAFIILLLSTLLTALALQKPLEPLLNISSTARKIASGQYNLRLPAMKTSTEIEQLRGTLNHMLEQMENALKIERTAKDRMSRFIADASHELRTPLTSIRGFLEILQRSDVKDQEVLAAALQTMTTETERLIRLTEGLLTLNRISQLGSSESDDQDRETGAVLEDTLSELLPLFSPLLEKRTLRLNSRIISDISDIEDNPQTCPVLPLKTDELKQILYNLISNAIDHTDYNGKIDIVLKEEVSRLLLAVRDNGRGIPEEDLPHIFERFFRGDKSRAYIEGRGAGLGLAIVSELVKARGGTIDAKSSPGLGTGFEIRFSV